MVIRKPAYYILDPDLLDDHRDIVDTMLYAVVLAAVVLTRPQDKELALQFGTEVVWAEQEADAYTVARTISEETDQTVLVMTPGGLVMEAVYADFPFVGR